MQRCDLEFKRLLVNFSDKTLNEYDGTIYGVWPDLTLAYFNSAWIEFAKNNGGEPTISRCWPLGTSIEKTLGPLTTFYRQGFAGCLRTNHIWTHTYECSSATNFRKFLMRAHPLGHGDGLLVVNSLLVERPRNSKEANTPPAEPQSYRDRNGLAHMCAHCRCIRQDAPVTRWIWVPAFVASVPDNVSHGLCPVCYEYHYPGHAKPDKNQ